MRWKRCLIYLTMCFGWFYELVSFLSVFIYRRFFKKNETGINKNCTSAKCIRCRNYNVFTSVYLLSKFETYKQLLINAYVTTAMPSFDGRESIILSLDRIFRSINTPFKQIGENTLQIGENSLLLQDPTVFFLKYSLLFCNTSIAISSYLYICVYIYIYIYISYVYFNLYIRRYIYTYTYTYISILCVF